MKAAKSGIASNERLLMCLRVPPLFLILEMLDRLGVTQRVGDARKLLMPLETAFNLASKTFDAIPDSI